MTMVGQQKCKVCSLLGTIPCSKCSKNFYCSERHKKQDIRVHRIHCFPVERGMSPTGPYLKTTQPIEMGRVVLKELPLFIGPGSYDFCFKYHTNPNLKVPPICLGCYQFLEIETKCDICQWPIHTDCQNEPWHKEFECKRMMGKVKYSQRDPTQYYHISLLRLLLLPTVLPLAWRKLERIIESHTERASFEAIPLQKMEALATAVRLKFALDWEISTSHMTKIYRTIQHKGIFNILPDEMSCTCIFEKVSLMSHDCMSNTRATMIPYKKNQPFQIQIYATRGLANGTQLTRNFAEESIQETFVRREKLRVLCGNNCECPRCLDPTELNTFVSAVCCPEKNCFGTQSGYILSQYPAEISLETPWQCTQCDYKTSYRAVQDYLESQMKKVISLKLSIAPSRRINVTGHIDYDLRVYEVILDGIEMILDRSKTLVHENHSILWPLKDAYMNLAAQALDVMTPEIKFHFADKLVEFSRSLLYVVLVISPGVCPVTGKLLYYLAKGLDVLIDPLADVKERCKILTVLDRLYGDALIILRLIRRFPESHGIPQAKEMIDEINNGLANHKYDGIQRLFSLD